MFAVRSVIAALAATLARKTAPASAYERGVAAFDAGRAERALEELNAAFLEADDDPRRARAQNKLGVVLIALRRRSEALAAFCRALEYDERHAPALVNLGNMLLEDGATQDAIDYYEAAVRADERYHLAYRNLAAALRRLGRRAESVRALRSAVRLEASRPAERS